MAGLSAGVTIAGRIKLERLLGEGGMGAVWVAEHIALGTRVAVKFIDAGLLERSPELRERFAREAAIAAKITSPHVVRTFDFGNLDDGTPYLVMELLSGESLHERLVRERPLPSAVAVDIIKQTAKALDDAHLHGVVHRDIKPGNIFLTQSGRDVFVKVLDFGIAKNVEPTAGSHATKTGMALGTPAYMSPEQLMSSKGVDLQADLWALAVTAYEVLFGVQPFRGETVPALIVAINSRVFDPPSSRAGNAPKGAQLAHLDGFFRRAFAQAPSERFATALDLAAAFAAAVEGRPIEERDASAASRTAYGLPLDVHQPPPQGTGTDPGTPLDDGAFSPSSEGAASPSSEAAEPQAFSDAPLGELEVSRRPDRGRSETPDGVSGSPLREPEKRPVWVAPAVALGIGILGIGGWLGVKRFATPKSDTSSAAPAASDDAPQPSATTSAAPTARAGELGPEFDVAEGTFSFSQTNADVLISGYHVRVLDRPRSSLQAAFAACRDVSMMPCTEAQWERACKQNPAVGSRAAWTSTESAGRAVIRGGGPDCGGSRSTSAFRGVDRSVLCCETAIASTTSVGPKNAMLDYMAALNKENIDGLVALYADSVSFNGTDHSNKELAKMAQNWFALHPDQIYALGVCAETRGVNASSWFSACPAMIYRDGELLGLDYRLGFVDRRVSSVSETGVHPLK